MGGEDRARKKIDERREQMWRTVKILGEFSVQDLAIAASTDGVQVSESDARGFIRMLLAGRYIAAVDKSVYRFLPSRNTGPKPPGIRRIEHIIDQNTGETVWRSDDDDQGEKS